MFCLSEDGHVRLILVVSGLTLAASNAAFVSSAFNIAETVISNFLNGNSTSNSSFAWSVAQSMPIVGAAIGMLCFAQTFMDLFGRQKTIIIQLAGSSVAFLIQGAAKYAMAPWMLYLGLFFEGLFLATMLVTLPVFLSEISPKDYRGCISSSLEFINKFWYVLGCVLGMPFALGNATNWTGIPFFAAVINFLVTICLLKIPESPKFLYLAKNKREAALDSFRFYQEQEISSENIIREWDAESKDTVGTASIWPKYSILFTDRRLRGSLLTSTFATLAWSFSAATALSSISIQILERMGLTSFASTVTIIVMYTVTGFAAAASSRLLDTWGRRPVVISSTLFNTLTWLALFLLNSIVGWANLSGVAAATVVPIVSAVWTILLRASSTGIAVFFYTAIPESYPFIYRSTAKTFFTFVSFALDAVVTLTFLLMIDAMASYTYLLMGCLQFVCVLYFAKFCEETKQLAVDEVLTRVNSRYRPEVSMLEDAQRQKYFFDGERRPLIGKRKKPRGLVASRSFI